MRTFDNNLVELTIGVVENIYIEIITKIPFMKAQKRTDLKCRNFFTI